MTNTDIRVKTYHMGEVKKKKEKKKSPYKRKEKKKGQIKSAKTT